MKHRLSLFAILVAALILTLSFTACRKPSRTPSEIFSDAVSATLADRGANISEETPAPTNSQISLHYKPTADTGALLPTLGEIKLDGFINKNGTQSASLSLSFANQPLTLDTYMAGSQFALSCSVLGNTTYGVDLSTAKEDYLDSIFSEVGGAFDLTSVFGVNGEIFDQLTKATPDFSAYETILNEYLDLLLEAVEDTMDATVTETEAGQQLVFVLDTADLKTILQGVYDYAAKDTKLRDAVNKILTGMELGEMDDVLAQYDDFFASPEALNDLFTTLDNNPFTLTLTVDLNAEELITKADLTFEATINGEAGEIVLTLDMSQANKTVIAIRSGSLKEPEDAVSASITHEVLENTESSYKESLSVSYTKQSTSVNIELYTLSYNKSTHAFNLSTYLLGAVTQPLSLQGTYQATEENMTLALTTLVLPGELFEAPEAITMAIDLTFAVRTGDTIAAPAELPAYTDVFALTEAQIEAIANEVATDPLVGILAEMFTPTAPDDNWDENWDEDWEDDYRGGIEM
ncbi:MAG: hypothetical protein E7618_05805 [Ruminococcaceae bacterium]|nr:hypothetical protein [Oscillospiraceae bacterium]